MRVPALIAGLSLAAFSAFAGDGMIRRSSRPVTGQYVVVFEEGQSSEVFALAEELTRAHRGRRGHVFEMGVEGFSIQMSEAAARALAGDPRVKFIEEDSIYTTAATPWGLDRIDQRKLPLDSKYLSNATGARVKVYLVDTGIRSRHQDFGSRVARGFNAILDGLGPEDCNGHGTHVAGIVGGSTFGVARSVTLVPVRVMDCRGEGTLSTILAGLSWVAGDYRSGTPAIVNLSLSGPRSSALDQAVQGLIDRGITVVTSAGNDDKDACQSSPARVRGAITVGASTMADRRASFSNYGECVDIFAPGEQIPSAWLGSLSSSVVLNGTSAAAGHVTGVAALFLQNWPAAAPEAVWTAVRAASTRNELRSAGEDSPNRLLYSAVSWAGGGTRDNPSPPGSYTGDDFGITGICTVVKPLECRPSP